jgi:uncharacterized protein (DUF433 family)
MPPRGHYLAHEVGRLAGVSGQTIGQWARREYIRSSQSSDIPRVYSYQDIAEAMVVHELLRRNVGYPYIKRAIKYLRTHLGTDWPLSRAKLSVPPDHPDAVGKKRTVVVRGELQDIDVITSDPVLKDVDLERIASDLSRGGWAARDVHDLQHIEVDPDRLSGRPVIRGRRVSAEDVARLAAEPGGVNILIEEYDLNLDQIADARRWWRAVQEYESAA